MSHELSYVTISVRIEKKAIACFNHDRERERRIEKNLFNGRAAAARSTCFCININVTARVLFSARENGGVSHRYLRYWRVWIHQYRMKRTKDHPVRVIGLRIKHIYMKINAKCELKRESSAVILRPHTHTRCALTHQRLGPISMFFSCCEAGTR